VKLGLGCLLAVALVVAGCGSHRKAAPTPPPTRADFVRRASAVCRTYYAKFNRLAQPRTLAEIGPYIDKASALIEAELRQLHRVEAPPALAVRYRTFLATGTKELALTRRLSKAAKAGDAASVRRLIANGQRIDAHANALAKAMGLRVCAQTPSTG
jgi:hypothetical protein